MSLTLILFKKVNVKINSVFSDSQENQKLCFLYIWQWYVCLVEWRASVQIVFGFRHIVSFTAINNSVDWHHHITSKYFNQHHNRCCWMYNIFTSFFWIFRNGDLAVYETCIVVYVQHKKSKTLWLCLSFLLPSLPSLPSPSQSVWLSQWETLDSHLGSVFFRSLALAMLYALVRRRVWSLFHSCYSLLRSG